MKAGTTENEPGDGPPFIASEEWIDEFERQSMAKGFETKIKRFARMRANMVGLTGRRIDEFYVQELVGDAIADTLAGVLAWHPERVSLEKHLLDAIGSRTRHDYVQAQRRPHLSLDPGEAEPSLMADVEVALAESRHEASTDLRSVTARAIHEIRSVAANDNDVLRLVDAYVAGADKKMDVRQESGLSSKRYEASRKRLHRIVRDLPTEIRDVLRT
jgi:hypothetical protein